MTQDKKPSSKKIISINEGLVQSQVSEMVRDTVEETLNAMLEAEAERLIGAQRYEKLVPGEILVPVTIREAWKPRTER